MYGSNGNVLVLPATGIGSLVLAAGTGHAGWVTFCVTVLAVWTITMAVRALVRILPKHEK